MSGDNENKKKSSFKTLRLILGDQLSHDISSLNDCDKDNDIILIAEVWDEATYVKHHKKKIAFLFSAMRHFSDELEDKGFKVHYTKLNDDENAGSFRGEVESAIKAYKIDKVVVTFPGEYRVLEDMKSWRDDFDCDVEIRSDDRFFSTPDDFAEWANDGRKELRMEYFYRQMRKDHGILVDDSGKPEGGKWNYDKQNRESYDGEVEIPDPRKTERDEITKDVIQLVEDRFGDHFGDLEPFFFAVTRKDALYVLDSFIKGRLPNFGTYQDAMVEGEPWMFHSHISFYLNCGLLSPREVVDRAVMAYHADGAPLNAVEGFVRQILGWREYIRGIYWYRMPDFKKENALNADRPLPWFFWTGETKMNCLSQCIKETKENAYAHHIQRLMVLGNFALIAGLSPEEVNEWYLIVYADAYEWVELPNVSGMILYADDGKLASKPYAASGSYINKMSDYCKNCHYNVKDKTGETACPFNYLYWDFMDRHQDKLRDNHRMGMIFNSYDRMSDEKKETIRKDSKAFLDSLEYEEN